MEFLDDAKNTKLKNTKNNFPHHLFRSPLQIHATSGPLLKQLHPCVSVLQGLFSHGSELDLEALHDFYSTLDDAMDGLADSCGVFKKHGDGRGFLICSGFSSQEGHAACLVALGQNLLQLVQNMALVRSFVYSGLPSTL